MSAGAASPLGSASGFRDGVWHALGQPYPGLGDAAEHTTAPVDGARGTGARATLCGQVADVVRTVGRFDPASHPAVTCQECAWWESVRTDTLTDTVARLAEPPRRGLIVALVEAILADADRSGDGLDSCSTVELLAAVSRHAGEALIDGVCADGECEHEDRSRCPITVVACFACSVVTGGWAGESEGRYRVEATVEAPCSLLRAMAAHYRIGAALFEDARLVDSLTAAGGGS